VNDYPLHLRPAVSGGVSVGSISVKGSFGMVDTPKAGISRISCNFTPVGKTERLSEGIF
jgi:hypothetical protein